MFYETCITIPLADCGKRPCLRVTRVAGQDLGDSSFHLLSFRPYKISEAFSCEKIYSFLGALLALGVAAIAQQPPKHFDGNSWWDHVQVSG